MTKLTAKMRLRPNFPFQELVTSTPGYVGADIQTLCKEASIIAVERVIKATTDAAKQSDEEVKDKLLTADDEEKKEGSDSEE